MGPRDCILLLPSYFQDLSFLSLPEQDGQLAVTETYSNLKQMCTNVESQAHLPFEMFLTCITAGAHCCLHLRGDCCPTSGQGATTNSIVSVTDQMPVLQKLVTRRRQRQIKLPGACLWKQSHPSVRRAWHETKWLRHTTKGNTHLQTDVMSMFQRGTPQRYTVSSSLVHAFPAG